MRKQLAGGTWEDFRLMKTGAAVYGAGEQRIGFVDTNVLMSQAPGRAEAEAQFKAAMENLQKQAKTLQDSAIALKKLYDAEMAKTDTAGRGKRVGVLETANDSLTAKGQKLQQ